MIGQHHRVDLDGVDQVGVVADDAAQLGLAHLLQLLGREGGRLVGQLVPEAIAAPHVAELGRDDAREGRPQHRAGQGALGHATGPEIHVRGVSGEEFGG